MASTLAVFIFARVAVTEWVRPHLLSPVRATLALTPHSIGMGITEGSGVSASALTPNLPNAWVYSSAIVDKAGRAPTAQFFNSECPRLVAAAAQAPLAGPSSAVGVTHAGPIGNTAFNDCAAKVAAHFHELVVYQPSSRYWPLQGLETALFVGLALLLGLLCSWWVRHRLS